MLSLLGKKYVTFYTCKFDVLNMESTIVIRALHIQQEICNYEINQ